MGSQILKTITEHKGNLTTNPDGIAPDPSRPIQQIAVPFATNPGTSKPIQQRLTLETASQGLEEFSKPIEQLGDFIHAPTFPDVVKDHIIQQILFVSDNHPSSSVAPKPESPIQQVVFVSPDSTKLDGQINSTNPIQQLILQTAGTDVSRPIEQVPRIENSIQITQFDFIDLIFPPCNSIKNPVNTNILWRIPDFGFPFDASSIIFTVEGIEVQDRAEFVVTNLPTGLQLFYDPPDNFDFDKQIVVTLTITDTAIPSNTFFLRCIWQTVPDVRGPFFRNITPACNSTDVSNTATVEFDVLDFGQGVDASSVELSIEGVIVCSGVSLEPITATDSITVSGVAQEAEASGFHVTYKHPEDPWRFGSEITLAISATDLAPARNSSLFICCFTVEDSVEPIFLGSNPTPCDSFVDNHTGLSFEVYGVEHGVDISTLEVRVDNKLRKVFVRPRLLRTD